MVLAMRVVKPCLNTLNSTSKIVTRNWNLIRLRSVVSMTSMKNIEEVKKNYQDIETLEDLEQNTTVIQIPDSDRLIISAY